MREQRALRIAALTLLFVILGAGLVSVPSIVRIASAAITTYYLHAANVNVGSSTYNSLSTSTTFPGEQTISANIWSNTLYTLSDSSGISIFAASSPVPAGYIWDLGGSWTFNVYVRAQGGTGTGYMRARIYRIASNGTATLLATTGDSTNVLGTTSYTLRTWSYTLASTTINENERFGVEFQINVTNRDRATSVQLAFDSSTHQSGIDVPITQSAAPTPTPTPTPTSTPTPTPTPTPLGPAHSDTVGTPYSATTDACAKCHRAHISSGPALRKTWPAEETLCLTCHDGTGAPNVQSQFSKTYKHPVASSVNIHRFGQEAPSQLSGSNRHVECEDCHEPHRAARGTHSQGSSTAAPAVQGTWGIDVTNTAAWTTPTYTATSSVANEYQLCFKCHSSWAYGTSPPLSHTGGITETDQSLEFNVENASYHWVEGDKAASSGTTPRTNDGRNMTFTSGSGWTRASKMTCTDCHASETTSDPRGPHGSTISYLLKGNWTTSTGKTGNITGHLCFACHDPNTYAEGGNAGASATGFSNGSRNLHTYHMGKQQVTGCQSCHSAVPHGYKYKSLLAPIRLGGSPGSKTGGTYISDPPYNTNSKLWVGTWQASGQWTQNNCAFFTGGDPSDPRNYDH